MTLSIILDERQSINLKMAIELTEKRNLKNKEKNK
jgi:hypothetical protein